MANVGPNGQPLPSGISWDLSHERFRLSYKDANGIWRREHAGRVLAAAKRQLAMRKREARQGISRDEGGFSAGLTLGAVADHWKVQQKRRGRRNVDREFRQYERHVAPQLGRRRVADIRPRHIRDLVTALVPELSGSSIHNVVSVLRSMFELAVFEELIEHNPAKALPRGVLPPISRKKQPTYTRDEAAALMTDERVPWDRRVFHSIQALTGARVGEVAGLRWPDYDPNAEPLGALCISRQYDNQPLKTAVGDDTKDRVVPVHPELARMLAEWKRHGFAAIYGRHPRPEDPIVPDRRTGTTSRTHSQVTKSPDKDCAAVGIPDKGTHGLRRFFISHTRMDGARAEVVERITHNRRGDIIDVYTSFDWSTLCEAVQCLRVDLRRGKLIQLPRAVNETRDISRDTEVSAGRKPNDSSCQMVEAVGIENIRFRVASGKYG